VIVKSDDAGVQQQVPAVTGPVAAEPGVSPQPTGAAPSAEAAANTPALSAAQAAAAQPAVTLETAVEWAGRLAAADDSAKALAQYIASSPEAVADVVELLGSSTPAERTAACKLTVYMMAMSALGAPLRKAVEFIAPAALSCLVQLLHSNSQSTQCEAADMLYELLLRGDQAVRLRVAAEPGALMGLLQLVGSSQDDSACNALGKLSYSGLPVQQRFVEEAGALSALVQLLDSSRGAWAARGLKSLAQGSAALAQRVAQEPGAINELVQLMQYRIGSKRWYARRAARQTLRALVDGGVVLPQGAAAALAEATATQEAQEDELQLAAAQALTAGIEDNMRQAAGSSLDVVRERGSSGPKRSSASQQDSVGTTARRVCSKQ
jgi:hypothetical protein